MGIAVIRTESRIVWILCAAISTEHDFSPFFSISISIHAMDSNSLIPFAHIHSDDPVFSCTFVSPFADTRMFQNLSEHPACIFLED